MPAKSPTPPHPDLRVLPVTVQAQTVAKLRDAILTGLFRPGERLVEGNLCEQMGVSRTSVREALRRLEAERLITIVPNRGPSVSEIDWAQAEEIYGVRVLLEAEAAGLFAARATPAEIAVMKTALAEFDAAVAANDALQQVASTGRFYQAIMRGCGNRVIAEILEGLQARISFLRARSMSHPGRAEQSAVEMRRMLDAIAAGKVKTSRAAASDHVRSAAAAARRYFDPVPE